MIWVRVMMFQRKIDMTRDGARNAMKSSIPEAATEPLYSCGIESKHAYALSYIHYTYV